MNPDPRYLFMVLALAGLSTTTTFIQVRLDLWEEGAKGPGPGGGSCVGPWANVNAWPVTDRLKGKKAQKSELCQAGAPQSDDAQCQFPS